MRPVRRGASPQPDDFAPYKDAQPHLIARMGRYCSYCERRIATQLAVDHIQPKGVAAYADLIGRWENYLLACVNCNSTKKDKNVGLGDVLLPDRDNTSAAFAYLADGRVEPKVCLAPAVFLKARDTLALTGLDKKIGLALDENGKQVAIDRVSQRMEVWATAEVTRSDVTSSPGNDAVRRLAVRVALGHGFFSIWMRVFDDDPEMRNRLIDAFEGTRDSGCFDPVTTESVSPAPNPDGLAFGGKL